MAKRPLMTVAEVAERMNCSVRHVYTKNDAGEMPPCIRFGGILRWEYEDIEELVARLKREAAEKLAAAKEEKGNMEL